MRAAYRDNPPLPSNPIPVYRDDCVWIIDGATNTVTHGPFCFSDFWTRVGIGDVEVGLDNDLFISFRSEMRLDKLWGETLVDFDPVRSRVVKRIKVLYSPDQMVRVGDALLYVATAHDLAVIDMSAHSIDNRLVLDIPGEKLIAGPAGKIYLGSHSTLASIDTGANSISYDPTEYHPFVHDIALGPDGHLYLLLFDRINIVDPENWETVASVQDPQIARCNGMRIGAVIGKVLVTCHDMKAVLVYDTAKQTVSSKSLPDSYFEIVAARDSRIYLLQDSAEKVIVLDTDSLQAVTEIPLRNAP